LAPDVFEPDDDGHSVVKVAVVPPELEAQARTGATNCPESAIIIED
jgi:ferredoxin